MKNATNIIIITLLVLLIGVGTALIFILMPSKKASNPSNGYVYSTGGAFLTNLKSGGHYIKADILIEVPDKDTLKTLEKNNHRIRDQIIDILGDIEEEDIEQQDFKGELRDSIKADLQTTLKTDKIKGIYFNEFIIQ